VYVLNVQRQIAQNIKFGQRPPSLRKSEGDEGSSDEEEVPRSPLKVLAQVEAEPVDTETKVKVRLLMANWAPLVYILIAYYLVHC
jgi:hypothetical protein